MDKMGSSDRAGNRGKPATPRDGCAVELTGLAYAVVSWLNRANTANSTYYPHGGVTTASGATWTWADWATKLVNNFQDEFYLPLESAHSIRKGYYKDVAHSSNANSEDQLRPNFLVTMTVVSCCCCFWCRTLVQRDAPSPECPISVVRLCRHPTCSIPRRPGRLWSS